MLTSRQTKLPSATPGKVSARLAGARTLQLPLPPTPPPRRAIAATAAATPAASTDTTRPSDEVEEAKASKKAKAEDEEATIIVSTSGATAYRTRTAGRTRSSTQKTMRSRLPPSPEQRTSSGARSPALPAQWAEGSSIMKISPSNPNPHQLHQSRHRQLRSNPSPNPHRVRPALPICGRAPTQRRQLQHHGSPHREIAQHDRHSCGRCSGGGAITSNAIRAQSSQREEQSSRARARVDGTVVSIDGQEFVQS